MKPKYGSDGVGHFVKEGTSQRPEIAEKYVGSKFYSVLGVMTHSTCNLSCQHCTVMPWMVKHGKNYEMTVENIENFIYWSKKSNYFFKRIVLSGGEPLIWNHLMESLRLLKKEKGRLYQVISIQTNLLKVTKKNIEWFREVLSLVDAVRVSVYLYNNKAIDLIHSTFSAQERQKITYEDRHTAFMKPVLKPVPNSLPAICACPDYNLYGDGVEICAGGRSIAISMGKTIEEDYPNYHVKIDRENYLDRLNVHDQLQQDLCQYCTVNTKTHVAIELEPNKNMVYKTLDDMPLIKNLKQD